MIDRDGHAPSNVNPETHGAPVDALILTIRIEYPGKYNLGRFRNR
jgi:hypothetical protein